MSDAELEDIAAAKVIDAPREIAILRPEICSRSAKGGRFTDDKTGTQPPLGAPRPIDDPRDRAVVVREAHRVRSVCPGNAATLAQVVPPRGNGSPRSRSQAQAAAEACPASSPDRLCCLRFLLFGKSER